MHHRANESFWKLYRLLPADIRVRADKQFALLRDNPQHSLLHLKKIADQAGQEIWSARITQKYRALAIRLPDQYLWFWIGEHAGYDQRLSRW